MTNHYLELELFRTTIQKLTFAYPLPLVTLYEFSTRCKRPNNVVDGKLIPEEKTTGFKRYSRILERLCNKSYSKNTAPILLPKPKIYDVFLLESQNRIYNITADSIGYKPIDTVFPISLIESAAFLDGAMPDYDTIAKEYPYYAPKKRKGISFLEFVLLLNIDLVVNKRALETLNRTIEDKRSEKLARKLADKLIKNINKQDMFDIYVYAFFDVLDEVKHNFHNRLAEQSAKEVWLPEHYAQRKDVFRALNTHISREQKTLPKEYKRTQIENIIASGDICEIMKMDNTLEDYNVFLYLESILDIAFEILLGDTEHKKNKVDKEYILAEEYAKAIKEYIFSTITEAEVILKRLYVDEASPLIKRK